MSDKKKVLIYPYKEQIELHEALARYHRFKKGRDKMGKEISPEIGNDLLNVVFDALTSAVSGIVLTDLGGNITFANNSFYDTFEYSPDDIIGTNVKELFSTVEVRDFSDVIMILDLSKNKREEFVVKKRDGTNIYVEVSASNISSASGLIVGRMTSFIDITQRKMIELNNDIVVQKLKLALEKIKTLEGIIPICAHCKKIRDDKGEWQQLESYIEEHSKAEFSHTICPECIAKYYPNISDDSSE